MAAMRPFGLVKDVAKLRDGRREVIQHLDGKNNNFSTIINSFYLSIFKRFINIVVETFL